MTRSKHSVLPAPMEGGGAYNRSSTVQTTGLLPATELLEQAAQAATLAPAPQPIVIADYGSSAGRNSLAPMAAAVAVLRRRAGMQQPISVVHTDLPGNDFCALFHTLATDDDSYLRADAATYASAIGRSFYEAILPPSSVSLGWSSWAVQWLSEVPMPIPDQVQAAYSRDARVREVYAALAASDWRRFLAARSREMRAGGRLVVLTMASDEDGDFGYRPLLDALQSGLLDLSREGLLRDSEVTRMTIPTVGRRHAEFAEPFGGAGKGAFEGLRLEHLEVFSGDDRIWSAFERNRDAQAFGTAWAAFSRASVFPTLAAALEGGSRDPRVASFCDQLEGKLSARLAAAPERMKIPLAKLVIAKADA